MDNIASNPEPPRPPKRRRVKLKETEKRSRPASDNEDSLPDLNIEDQGPPLPDEHLDSDPEEYEPKYDDQDFENFDPNQQEANENLQQQENQAGPSNPTQNTGNNAEFSPDIQHTIDELTAAANGASNDVATNEQATETPAPDAAVPSTSAAKGKAKTSTKGKGKQSAPKTSKTTTTTKLDRWGRAVQSGQNIKMEDLKGEELATDDYSDMPPMSKKTCYEYCEELERYNKENIRGTDNRHYARFDRNQTCTGDQHNYCLRRFVLEGWPICGIENQPYCYYCKRMTPKAREHRVSEAKKYLKHPNMIAPMSKWKRLHPSIKNNAMAFQLCVSRGMMYEFSEAVGINSKMPLKPTNYMNCHASTQTKISMTICGPHPEDSRRKIFYKAMPPAEKQLRIWNTNYHAERFVYKEFADLYSDAIEWNKYNDPGQFYMSAKMKQALIFYEKFLAACAEKKTTIEAIGQENYEKQYIENERIAEIATDQYSTRYTNEDSDTKIEYQAYRFPSKHPLDHTQDGLYFDPAKLEPQHLYNYHRYWMTVYARRPGVLQEDTYQRNPLPEETQPQIRKQLFGEKHPPPRIDPVLGEPMLPEDRKPNDLEVNNNNDRLLDANDVTRVNAGASTSTNTNQDTIIKQEIKDVKPFVGRIPFNTIDIPIVSKPGEDQKQKNQLTVNIPVPLMAQTVSNIWEYLTEQTTNYLQEVLKPKPTNQILGTITPTVDISEERSYIPCRLYWKYENKFANIIPVMKELNDDIEILNMAKKPHPDDVIKKERKFESPAGVQLSTEITETITRRLGDIKSHLRDQITDKKKRAEMDTHAASTVNIAPYQLQESRLPILTYEVCEDDEFAREHVAPTAKFELASVDIEVWEQYVKLIVSAVNMATAITSAIETTFTDTQKQLPRYASMLFEKHSAVLEDLRQAAVELLVDVVTTRRLRLIEEPDQHPKNKFVKLVTSTLSDGQWLYTGKL